MITEEDAQSLDWLSQGMADSQSQKRIANLFYKLLEEGRLLCDTLEQVVNSRKYTDEWGERSSRS